MGRQRVDGPPSVGRSVPTGAIVGGARLTRAPPTSTSHLVVLMWVVPLLWDVMPKEL